MIEPMVAENRRRATYQDVLDAPPNMVAEVIDGVLYLQPRPRMRHAVAGTRLGAALTFPPNEAGKGEQEWIVLDEPELHLGSEPDIVVPDIAAWRRQRLADVDLAEDPAFLTTAPDWLCEVLSPSTARKDRMLKLPLYLREGVRWVWLVDANAKVIEVFAADARGWRLVETRGDGDTETIRPFDDMALNLDWLWDL